MAALFIQFGEANAKIVQSGCSRVEQTRLSFKRSKHNNLIYTWRTTNVVTNANAGVNRTSFQQWFNFAEFRV